MLEEVPCVCHLFISELEKELPDEEDPTDDCVDSKFLPKEANEATRG
jgi:hypothetical protein